MSYLFIHSFRINTGSSAFLVLRSRFSGSFRFCGHWSRFFGSLGFAIKGSSALFGSAVKVLRLFFGSVKVLRLSQFCGQGSSALMGPLALSVLQLRSFGSSLQLLRGFICKLRSEKY
ncbi:uncharacterized protein OCT59_027647 [Rhizophagus irregularis]|uniref:uncharacterized protein n=1 Tax=Rhizophagus irregularis TaxID=588596 RepID=UPI0033311940|nr:hypothetical protein OCT59_027647 [Rhizophagus irregularis]